MSDLKEVIKSKFKHLSNQELINKANRAADFGWDDEGYEINRRGLADPSFKYAMLGNKIVIIKP